MGRVKQEFTDYKRANAYSKRLRRQGYYADGYAKGRKIVVVGTPYRSKGSTVLTRSYITRRRRTRRRQEVRT